MVWGAGVSEIMYPVKVDSIFIRSVVCFRLEIAYSPIFNTEEWRPFPLE